MEPTPAPAAPSTSAAPSAPGGLVTWGITVSVDGFVAGPRQSLDNPIGEGGARLHRWMFEQPEANAPEIAALTSAGAYIMGRNMFGPSRGEWDMAWRGWWGEEPPYHAPVFVPRGSRRPRRRHRRRCRHGQPVPSRRFDR
jgi:dihydrofolate reductase